MILKMIKKAWLKRKYKKEFVTLWAKHHEEGKGKGGDIWGSDWPIPVAEEFEWHFYDDLGNGKQYITTKLTDYILGFIPFSYAEYVYELPEGTYKPWELTTKTVVDKIYFLDHWNWHTDEVYWDDSYDTLSFKREEDGRYDDYKFGNNDYHFIRTKG